MHEFFYSKHKFIIQTNQLNVSAIISSHHQAHPKSIKINNTAATLVGVLGSYNVLCKTYVLFIYFLAFSSV